MTISFSLSPDQTMIERDNYTFIDVLADLGGLQASLYAVLSAVLSVINYNNFNNYLASQLYNLHSDDEGQTMNKF